MGVLAAIFLVVVTWVVFGARRGYPYLLVGWLWFLGTLVPVIGFVQIGKQSMNDHHAYVPMIGIFIVLVFLARDFSRALPRATIYPYNGRLWYYWQVASSPRSGN